MLQWLVIFGDFLFDVQGTVRFWLCDYSCYLWQLDNLYSMKTTISKCLAKVGGCVLLSTLWNTNTFVWCCWQQNYCMMLIITNTYVSPVYCNVLQGSKLVWRQISTVFSSVGLFPIRVRHLSLVFVATYNNVSYFIYRAWKFTPLENSEEFRIPF